MLRCQRNNPGSSPLISPNPPAMFPSILQIGNVLLSADVLTEYFECDLDACHGQCCIEGDAGAPVTLDEIANIENALPQIESELTPEALGVINEKGVAYTDREGDLVTSLVRGRDCAFLRRADLPTPVGLPDGCALCALEGRCKPISCSLYPIRAKVFGDGSIGLNYNRWKICDAARIKGKANGTHVYQFLRAPLVRRFGQAWYDELCEVAERYYR